MPNMDIFDFANQLLDKNPQVANNPQNQALVQAIRNRNPQEGQRIAQDICRQHGMLPTQALEQIGQFFNQR